MYGLMPKGNESLVPYAIRMLSDGSRSTDADKYFGLAREFKRTFGANRICKPWLVGIWDTVSSVGWIENPLHLPYMADNPDIHIGRHAIAIDERRAFYRTNLWRPKDKKGGSGPKDLKQVWFPGVHCDVGGGYPEGESALSDVALKWMLDEALQAGLLLDQHRYERIAHRVTSAAEAAGPPPIHNSLKLVWWPAELLWKRHYDWKRREWRRRMNLGRRRTIPPGALVHLSALHRGDSYKTCLGDNVVIVP
jgi:uncharacterized protein (DUF2235 family)